MSGGGDSNMEAKSHCRAKIRGRTRIIIWISSAILLLAASPLLAGNFYSGTSPANVPWPGGIVPYEFTNTLPRRKPIPTSTACANGNWRANVKFVPHTNQTRWILFTYNTNFLDLRVRRQLQPANCHRLQPQPGAGLPRDGPLLRLHP